MKIKMNIKKLFETSEDITKNILKQIKNKEDSK